MNLGCVVGPRLIDGRGVLGGVGGFWGGLITFLAARLTRSSLGLAATLGRTVAGKEALDVNRSPIKQFTRPVMRKPSSVLSSVAGTQSIDRAWRTLKAWLPQKLKTYEKRNGHHIMNQNVHSMIQQWMWRQTILPCSPKELMSRLVDLLKKHHDFQ